LDDVIGLGVMRSPITAQEKLNSFYRYFTVDNILVIQQQLTPQ
jgi:hypothetical protein